MQKNTYDVTIAYRIYPKVSKVPPIHPQDKYQLSELCLKSLRLSLGSLKVKMIALLDNCPDEYIALFQKYFTADELEIISLPGVGNHQTFQKQIELLLEQDYSETVYFAEDDYFYIPGQFEKMVRFQRSNPEVHFITSYDHPDYYTMDIHHGKFPITVHSNHHWRTAATTCLTFMTTKAVLRKSRKTLESFCRGNLDNAVWLALTKTKINSPYHLLRYFFRWLNGEKMFLGMAKNAWIYCPLQLLFGKRWRLWSPIPSLSTHMDSTLLAPNIDWQKLFSGQN